jgi:spermidine synthase
VTCPAEITRVLPEMVELKTAVPVERADDALRVELEQKGAVLMEFYTGGQAVYGRDEETWQRSIARVQTMELGNAYYAWVIGRD